MITFPSLNKSRLGNQLFQVASTIGIAVKNNQEWGFPHWEHPFDMPVVTKRFKTINVPWGYHDIKVDDSASISGYLQSEKYFKHCEDLIRELFAFKTSSAYDFIAVHVRRGDYDDRYNTLLGSDYYDKALSLLPDLPVVLFSDDMKEAERIIGTGYIAYHIDPWSDIAMMVQAKYHVIANSTFSWWGAWLSGSDRVIAPAQWFGKLSRYSTKDLYTDKMIVI